MSTAVTVWSVHMWSDLSEIASFAVQYSGMLVVVIYLLCIYETLKSAF